MVLRPSGQGGGAGEGADVQVSQMKWSVQLCSANPGERVSLNCVPRGGVGFGEGNLTVENLDVRRS